MSAEGDRPDPGDRPISELDRIRDIIFGSQMQDYQGQFSRIAAELGLLSQQLGELRTTIAQQKAAQDQRLDELERDFSEKSERLNSNLTQTHQLAEDLRTEFAQALDALKDDKASRLDVGDILVEMGTRLKDQFGVADLLGAPDTSASSEDLDRSG